ncbi:MAG: type IV toxin-antitoxin system AbiEi family antitoxin domain-containing protein [Parvibaculaceae bacterium]
MKQRTSSHYFPSNARHSLPSSGNATGTAKNVFGWLAVQSLHYERKHTLLCERATVRTCDFTALGIPRHYLAWMCEEGLLLKVGYGVYRAVQREDA